MCFEHDCMEASFEGIINKAQTLGEESNMESVEFERPGTEEEAVAMLQGTSGNAKILAGGNDLLEQ